MEISFESLYYTRCAGLKNIAGGKYEEPVSKKGKPVRFRRSGKEKWSFRIFKDVTNSLEHLSITLKKNDAMRKVLQQTREEWITGLTHDLKTPLSSYIRLCIITRIEAI